MSSFGTKNHPHHPHHHAQLRRQKTCFEVGSTNKTTSTMMASSKRGFCLQRQLSVDATSVLVSPAKFVSAYEKQNILATTTNSSSTQDLNSWKCGSNTSVNDRHAADHYSSPKSTAVPIIKKRTTQSTSISNIKTAEPETPDRHKKALKDRGNRLNLNIFLSHSTNSQDGDINGSDAESSNESMTIVNKENSNMAKSDVPSNCNKTSESNSNNISNSNDSDNSNNNNNNNNQVPVKKIPDANVKPVNGRRPPLVRAMSAPIRPKNDDAATTMAGGGGGTSSDSKMIQVKRKIKKKKNLVTRDSREDILEEKFDEPDIDLDDISNSSDSTSNLVLSSPTTINITSNCINSNEIKKQIKIIKKPTLQRPRSAAVGNEVVTLVSLLSSGGSDSEREDNHTALPVTGPIPTTAAAAANSYKTDVLSFNARHRAPMLRKSGKSVSFQERDLLPEIPSSTKDFSKYRRGSVAPIAARLRSNRPPTAPAGSIYLCDIDINNDDFMKSIKTSTNNRFCSSNDFDADIANGNTRNENKILPGESKVVPAVAADEVEEIEINYPENVRTPKERECWRLYQKMLNRGVTVSYDTILRGMLTPTELRIIQKQNESKRFFDMAEQVCDGSGSNTPTSSENGNVFSTTTTTTTTTKEH